jgi:hypothetical protein
LNATTHHGESARRPGGEGRHHPPASIGAAADLGHGESGEGRGGQADGGERTRAVPPALWLLFLLRRRGQRRRATERAPCSAPLRSVSCEQCVRAASLSAAPAVSSYPFRSLPTPRTRWPLFLFGRPPLSREASAVQCSTVEEKKDQFFSASAGVRGRQLSDGPAGASPAAATDR